MAACPQPNDYYAYTHDYADHEQILAHYDTVRQVFEEAAELVVPLFVRAIHVAAKVERVTRAGHLADELQQELESLLDYLQPREEAYLDMLQRMRNMRGNDTHVTEYGETSLLFQRKNELINRINDNLAVIQQRDEARFQHVQPEPAALEFGQEGYDGDCSETTDNEAAEAAHDYGYDWEDTLDRELEREREKERSKERRERRKKE